MAEMVETSETEDFTLCLSGGGLRATYFHLGAIWALRQQGLLKKVKKVYSVSGGSITAAHVALNWSRYTGLDPNDAVAAAKELIVLATRDVRRRVVRRTLLAFLFLMPLLNSLLWLFGKSIPIGRTDFLEAEYRTIVRKAELKSLKVVGGPEFFVLGTSFLTGDVCIFSSQGYAKGSAEPYGGKEFSLAKAV